MKKEICGDRSPNGEMKCTLIKGHIGNHFCEGQFWPSKPKTLGVSVKDELSIGDKTGG